VEHRFSGRAGLKVSTLALATMTFGGRGELSQVGSTQVAEARRLIARALEARVNLVDAADMYPGGIAEEIAQPNWSSSTASVGPSAGSAQVRSCTPLAPGRERLGQARALRRKPPAPGPTRIVIG
jgi:hypothetical protein